MPLDFIDIKNYSQEFVVVSSLVDEDDKSSKSPIYSNGHLKSLNYAPRSTSANSPIPSNKVVLRAFTPNVRSNELAIEMKRASKRFLLNGQLENDISLWGNDTKLDMEELHQQFLDKRKKLIENLKAMKNNNNNNEKNNENQNDIISHISSGDSTSTTGTGLDTDRKKKKHFKRLYNVSSASTNGVNALLNKVETDSKTKNTLKNLNKFVEGYSNRKIMAHWDIVESKYKSSIHFQVVMERGQDGLSYPVKHKVLHLSAVTMMLCSEEIKIKHKELAKLYKDLGFTTEQTDLSRKIAALKLVLRTIDDPNSRMRYTALLEKLLAGGEPNISLAQLKTKIFPTDPLEYKRAVDTIEKERTMRLMQLVEDRRLKAEMQAKTERRIAKSAAEFEIDLKTIQYAKGPLVEHRRMVLIGVIEFARAVLYDAANSVVGGVDPEVVELIGPDMFPGKIGAAVMTKQLTEPRLSGGPLVLNNQLSSFAEDPAEHLATGDRIYLSGNPTVLTLLRQCVASGKGLNGTAFGDVVELLQALASTNIAAYFRGFNRRWRYRAAKNMWTSREHRRVVQMFADWKKTTKYMTAIKKHCWRKIKGWQSLLRRNKRRREIFRIVFWPFYVWRYIFLFDTLDNYCLFEKCLFFYLDDTQQPGEELKKKLSFS